MERLLYGESRVEVFILIFLVLFIGAAVQIQKELGRKNAANFTVTGKLLDYYPTTSKSLDRIIHDRPSFFRNTAEWIVENHGNRDGNLRAIIGVNSGNLTLHYSLDRFEGLLLVRLDG